MSDISSIMSGPVGAGASAGGLSTGAALGLGLGGSILGTAFNALSQGETNTMSQEEQTNQQQFEYTMSNTAHQREVQDLQKAGLNPILSAGGSGATTPSVGMAPLQAPQVQMPDVMNMALQMKALDQKDAQIAIDRANSASNIARNSTQNDLTKMQTILAQRGLIPAELEGQGAQMLQGFMNRVKNQFSTPNPKHLPTDSSGGSFPTNPGPSIIPEQYNPFAR